MNQKWGGVSEWFQGCDTRTKVQGLWWLYLYVDVEKAFSESSFESFTLSARSSELTLLNFFFLKSSFRVEYVLFVQLQS